MLDNIGSFRENDFQRFCSVLLSADDPSFQAVNGAGGDMGNDGFLVAGDTLFQAYGPRKEALAKLRKKVDDSIAKATDLRTTSFPSLTRIVLLTPFDLTQEMHTYFRDTSCGAKLAAESWGEAKLASILARNPEVRSVFPEYLLPDIVREVRELRDAVHGAGDGGRDGHPPTAHTPMPKVAGSSTSFPGLGDTTPPHVPSQRLSLRRLSFAATAVLITALMIVVGLRTRGSARSPCPPQMVYLAGGTFRMGAEDYDKEAAGDERPAHDVTLSAFCIDATEVTVERYRDCTSREQNGAKCPSAPLIEQRDRADLKFWYRFCNRDGAGRDSHPINCIDWATAATYCKWTGGALPTEAQWEYTAKGSKQRRFPWGNEPPGARMLNACGVECRDLAIRHQKTLPAMHGENDGAETTAPVGSYPGGGTPEGVLDMAGNVAEWVRDTKDGYDSTVPKDPVHTAGQLHVLRGGSWYSSTPRAVRTTTSDSLENSYYLNVVGFRCVHEVDR